MLRKLSLVAVFLAAGVAVPVAQAVEVHDCRIGHLGVKIVRTQLDRDTPGFMIRVLYAAQDGSGAILTQRLCPDQLAPTVSTDAGVLVQQDDLGYVYFLSLPDPGVYSIDVATQQGAVNPRVLTTTRRFLVR